jgi:hypothetical protein
MSCSKEMTLRGSLIKENENIYILSPDGKKLLQNDLIWDGYILHWQNKEVCARRLSERDYDQRKPIVLIWPDEEKGYPEKIALYYLERLPKYRGSLLGHSAINVNGVVFNFSYRINENEALREEEYLYRPALGKFAPDPLSKRNEGFDGSNPYYDNFGRIFMRSIHVMTITGTDIDLKRLSSYFYRELEVIRKCPADPKKPHIYRDFNLLNRSCTTIVRDGLREMGWKKIKGIAPRDLFIDAYHYFYKTSRSTGYHVKVEKIKQLKVPEAPFSFLSPVLNPSNWFKNRRLSNDVP